MNNITIYILAYIKTEEPLLNKIALSGLNELKFILKRELQLTLKE